MTHWLGRPSSPARPAQNTCRQPNHMSAIETRVSHRNTCQPPKHVSAIETHVRHRNTCPPHRRAQRASEGAARARRKKRSALTVMNCGKKPVASASCSTTSEGVSLRQNGSGSPRKGGASLSERTCPQADPIAFVQTWESESTRPSWNREPTRVYFVFGERCL